MEVDDGNGSSLSHNHKEGFRCSAIDCNWASIDAKNFDMHHSRKHRHDDPRPNLLPTWVIPLNPSKTRKRYRACCSTQQHQTEEVTPNQGDEQTGMDVEGLQHRKRQRLSSTTATEQEQARQSNNFFVPGPHIMIRNDANYVGPSSPSNTRGLNPIYQKTNWFTEEDRLTKDTRYHEHKHLLFHLTQGPCQGIDHYVFMFLFFFIFHSYT